MKMIMLHFRILADARIPVSTSFAIMARALEHNENPTLQTHSGTETAVFFTYF